ncbi:MAG: hypothetical protein JXA25_16135 [Anaerolineales bacterium]|nr:hypothetical protein [Anaerolineales bacterium]
MRDFRLVSQNRNELHQGYRVLRSVLLIGFVLVLGIETWLMVQIMLTNP